jgi:Reverse transcriptase (RNA-dependent DNA polymerase)
METLSKYLTELGLMRMNLFPSVFFKQDKDNQNKHAFRTFVGPKIIVTVYVNNILIIGKNKTIINLFKKSLNAHFKIKNLGEAANYLGIKIK